MPGVTRIYTYRFTPPGDALTLAVAMSQVAEKVVKFNKYVEAVHSSRDGEDMLLHITMRGHDQWKVKQQVIYPVAGIMTKLGIKLSELKLVSVERPPDPRSTRPRASDGRSKPLDGDFMIDHEELIQT